MSTLTHHGILGMKWGKRNGPPYPLSMNQKSAAEKSADNQSNSNSEKDVGVSKRSHSGLTDKQKHYIKVGAAATGVALAAIGTAYLVKSGTMDGLISSGQERFNSMFGLGGSTIDPVSGLPKLDHPRSVNSALDACNYGFGETLGRSRNCGNTTIAFEMQQQGFDVQALPNEQGMSIAHMGRYFSGMSESSFCTPNVVDSHPNLSMSDQMAVSMNKWTPDLIRRVKQRGKDISQTVSEQLSKSYPDGSRGNMLIPSFTGSHWISWEKKGGKIVFYNPQKRGVDLSMVFGTHEYFRNNSAAQMTAIRLDNLKLNLNNIKEVVEPAGRKNDSDFGSFRAYNSYGDGFVMTDTELKDTLGGLIGRS